MDARSAAGSRFAPAGQTGLETDRLTGANAPAPYAQGGFEKEFSEGATELPDMVVQ